MGLFGSFSPCRLTIGGMTIETILPQRLLVLAPDDVPSRKVDEITRRLLDHLRLESVLLGPSSNWPLHGADTLDGDRRQRMRAVRLVLMTVSMCDSHISWSGTHECGIAAKCKADLPTRRDGQ